MAYDAHALNLYVTHSSSICSEQGEYNISTLRFGGVKVCDGHHCTTMFRVSNNNNLYERCLKNLNMRQRLNDMPLPLLLLSMARKHTMVLNILLKGLVFNCIRPGAYIIYYMYYMGCVKYYVVVYIDWCHRKTLS